MVATVLRRAFVGEGLVVADVVAAHAVDAVGPRMTSGGVAQVADQRGDRDVHDVVAEATPVGPAARDNPPLPKGSWIWLWSTSPPKMLSREKPGSSGFVGCPARCRPIARPESRGPL